MNLASNKSLKRLGFYTCVTIVTVNSVKNVLTEDAKTEQNDIAHYIGEETVSSKDLILVNYCFHYSIKLYCLIYFEQYT